MPESTAYDKKRAFFDRVLTVYGRKPVLETLQNVSLECHAVHLADSNQEGGIIAEIRNLAQRQGVPVKLHSRQELRASRTMAGRTRGSGRCCLPVLPPAAGLPG
ncbi:MAG: RNA methyltransferase substrate-binding domain-containing protein [Halioglobus sp.]